MEDARLRPLNEAREYLQHAFARHLEDLVEFLTIPSVSAQTAHAADLDRAAEWLAERLGRAGIVNVAVESPAPRAPKVVRGEWMAAGPTAPTVLVYGHYDVQPADPGPPWETPPFQPLIQGDVIRARGASDDKGPLFMSIAAAEAWLQTTGRLPVNLRWLLEGEEEVGSPHLAAYLAARRRELTADVAVICDTPMFAADQPAICYGLRGLAALDVRVEGPRQDLHSGTYGGAVANPAAALSRVLASLHDSAGRVRVAGFYDQVRPLDPEERRRLQALPFDDAAFLDETGAPGLWGEPEFSPWERLWTRPTLEINGMWSGYLGEGRKTIIPHDAQAKLTCRLVPDQDPAAVLDAVRRHLEAHCPAGVRLTTELDGGEPAVVLPLDHPAVVAASRAIAAVWGRDPVFIRTGGSIPVVGWLHRELALPSLLLGFSQPDDGFHAPNERFRLSNFRRGSATLATLWGALGRVAADPTA